MDLKKQKRWFWAAVIAAVLLHSMGCATLYDKALDYAGDRVKQQYIDGVQRAARSLTDKFAVPAGDGPSPPETSTSITENLSPPKDGSLKDLLEWGALVMAGTGVSIMHRRWFHGQRKKG